MPLLENKTAIPKHKERSNMFPPTTSPKESSGTLLRAEKIPTVKFGKDTEKAIKKKATTNSFQPRNLQRLDTLFTNSSLEKDKTKKEKKSKMK
jgi:hypothetical protein